MKKNRRGSVLLHVLVTSVVVAFIAAGMVRMLMLRYMVTTKDANVSAKKKDSEAILHRLITHWNQSPANFCTSPPNLANAPNIVCNNSACGPCACSVGGVAGKVLTTAGTPCQIQVISLMDDI